MNCNHKVPYISLVILTYLIPVPVAAITVHPVTSVLALSPSKVTERDGWRHVTLGRDEPVPSPLSPLACKSGAGLLVSGSRPNGKLQWRCPASHLVAQKAGY